MREPAHKIGRKQDAENNRYVKLNNHQRKRELAYFAFARFDKMNPKGRKKRQERQQQQRYENHIGKGMVQILKHRSR